MAETATRLPVRDESRAEEKAPEPKTVGWPTFTDLRREVDRLFDDFGRDWFTTPALFRGIDRVPAWAERPVMPAVDVVETEGAWRITAELPGMDEKAVDVTIAGDVLTLKGEKTEEKDEDRTGTRVTERRYGAFARSFTLPPGIDRGAIDAAFANGVLTVTLPKLAAATPAETRIEVKAA